MRLRDFEQRWALTVEGDGAAGGEGGAGGSGSGTSGDGAGAASDKAGAGASLLAAAAGADGGKPDGEAAAGADGRPAWLPEKFWNAEKKEANAEALARSYGDLEKRFKAGVDLPPKDAAEYKLELAKDEEFTYDEAKAKDFAKWAHEQGLNNKQYNAAIRAHVQWMDQAMQEMRGETRTQAKDVLTKHYGSEAKLNENLALAYRAFRSVADDAEMAAIDEIGDSPVLIKVLAKLQRAMGEDRAPAGGGGQESIETEVQRLMKAPAGDPNSAYWNPKHPDHEAAVAKVAAYHREKTAEDQRKRA